VRSKVKVAVDQARQDGATGHVDDLGSGWIRKGSSCPHGRDPGSLDNDDSVGERRPAGAVNERAAFKYERTVLGQNPGRSGRYGHNRRPERYRHNRRPDR
jgi:hypothetical protein